MRAECTNEKNVQRTDDKPWPQTRLISREFSILDRNIAKWSKEEITLANEVVRLSEILISSMRVTTRLRCELQRLIPVQKKFSVWNRADNSKRELSIPSNEKQELTKLKLENLIQDYEGTIVTRMNKGELLLLEGDKQAHGGTWLLHRSENSRVRDILHMARSHVAESNHDDLRVIYLASWLNRLLEESLRLENEAKTSELKRHNELVAKKQAQDAIDSVQQSLAPPQAAAVLPQPVSANAPVAAQPAVSNVQVAANIVNVEQTLEEIFARDPSVIANFLRSKQN